MAVRRSRLPRGLSLLTLGLLAACGDGSSVPTQTTSAQQQYPSGVEISGNVLHYEAGGSILIFAMSEAQEPVSVGVIGNDGAFTLSALPAGSLGLVFLDDKSSDGVIDKGDPVATLDDPNLRGLQEGDRVHVTDVGLNFRGHKATAARVEVEHAGGSEPAVVPATPTPIP